MAADDMMTTLALGEEEVTPDNPDLYDPRSWLKPGKGDDWATTMAVGEEGSPEPWPGEVTTMACGEEGNDCGIDLDPIEMTTMALGEEGGDPYDIF